MSLRTMERILLSTSLIFGLSAMGCGDGDDVSSDAGTKPMDSGVKDAGPKDSGPKADTGGDEEELPSMACGSNTCTGILLSEVVVDPCCVVDGAGKATDQCGLDSVDIKRVNSTSPFSGCVPKDVPKASDSAYCGEFWDQVEMGGKVNGGLDIKSGTVTLTFDGCCLPTGECGALIDTPRGQNADDLNTHLGCVSFTRLSTALNGADAGAVAQPEHLPYCNSSTGSPLKGDETVTGKPKFVCGCGDGKVDEGKGTFPCFNNLPTTVCGADQPKAEELAMIPEFICGCTQASKLPCMVNVAAATCGTKQIDANSVELALVPVFICGESATPSALPTLKGVDPAVCGKKAVAADSDDLAAVPEFICGEMGNPPENPLPKLKNLPATTCGRLAIGADSPYLASIPEFICGQEGLTATPSLPVMPNVDKAVCGTKQIDANSVELALIPEFICGQEGLTAVPALPVMQGVDMAVCGKKEITTDSSELARVPVFICGAVGTQPNGLPQMANVETAVCGKKPITQDSIELDGVPAFICGELGGPNIGVPRLRNLSAAICGELPIANGSIFIATIPEFLCGCTGRLNPALGCLRNLANEVCGGLQITTGNPYLNSVPKFVCGCGATTLDTEHRSLCMGNVEADLCGARPDQVTDRGATGPSAEDCLTGVPEYAGGCGAVETPTGQSCLRQTPAFPGCDDVTSGPVLRLPEYMCGCGDGNTYTGSADVDGPVPCLNFVATSICGALPIAVSQQVSPLISNQLCGCGDGVTTAATCLDNVPPSVCGALPICILGQVGAAANCNNPSAPVCVDGQGGVGATVEQGGGGGAGDSIGDHCVPVPPG